MNAESGKNSKKKGFQIVLAIPMIFFLYLAAHGIFSDYNHIKTQRHLLAVRTSTAEGAIVQLYDAAHGTVTVHKETIVFTTDSGREISFSATANKGDKIGKTMPVHYDSSNPDNFAVGEQIFSYSDLFYGNVFFTLAGLFFLFLICWIRRTPDDEL
jgi:hypothetical protein